MDNKDEFLTGKIIKIQEALKPLGYRVTGCREKQRPDRIILHLTPIYNFVYLNGEIADSSYN